MVDVVAALAGEILAAEAKIKSVDVSRIIARTLRFFVFKILFTPNISQILFDSFFQTHSNSIFYVFNIWSGLNIRIYQLQSAGSVNLREKKLFLSPKSRFQYGLGIFSTLNRDFADPCFLFNHNHVFSFSRERFTVGNRDDLLYRLEFADGFR